MGNYSSEHLSGISYMEGYVKADKQLVRVPRECEQNREFKEKLMPLEIPW